MLERVIREFRQNKAEYITMMLLAGAAMMIIFLPLDAWFGLCCMGAGIFFALVMWLVSIALDIQEGRRHIKPQKETNE